jgi:hypothetical protein
MTSSSVYRTGFRISDGLVSLTHEAIARFFTIHGLLGVRPVHVAECMRKMRDGALDQTLTLEVIVGFLVIHVAFSILKFLRPLGSMLLRSAFLL